MTTITEKEVNQAMPSVTDATSVKVTVAKVIVLKVIVAVKATVAEKAIMAKATAVATNSSFKRSTYQLSKNFNNR